MLESHLSVGYSPLWLAPGVHPGMTTRVVREVNQLPMPEAALPGLPDSTPDHHLLQSKSLGSKFSARSASVVVVPTAAAMATS